MDLSTRQGTPTATTFSGMDLDTTLPAPITELSPMVTPARTVVPAPIQTLLPILIGFAIAFLLQPLIRTLARKSGGHERLWTVLTVIVFYMTIGAGIAILFYQGAQFAADLRAALERLRLGQ